MIIFLQRKRGKEHKRKDENTANGGLDPYDDDDEDKLKEMAKKFEAKYVRIIIF